MYIQIHTHVRFVQGRAQYSWEIGFCPPTVRRCRLLPPVFPPSLTSDLIKPWQVRICLCSGNKSSTIAARHTGHFVNELNTRQVEKGVAACRFHGPFEPRSSGKQKFSPRFSSLLFHPSVGTTFLRPADKVVSKKLDKIFFIFFLFPF